MPEFERPPRSEVSAFVTQLSPELGVLDSFRSHLHLPSKLENAPNFLPRRLGNQDLAADRIGLNAGGEIDVTSDHAILHPFGRADVSQHNLAGMDANPHF